jgi:hypothetical protein
MVNDIKYLVEMLKKGLDLLAYNPSTCVKFHQFIVIALIGYMRVLICKGLPNHLKPYSRICGGFQRYILCKLSTERKNEPVGVSKEKSLKETRASHRFGIYTLEL